MHNDDVNDGDDFCAKHMFRNMHADRACFGAAKLRLDEVFACRVIASYGESTHVQTKASFHIWVKHISLHCRITISPSINCQ